MQTENHCGIRPLTNEEIQDLIQCEAADMDTETTAEFINDLIDAGGAEINDCTRIERIMWLVRHAYLSGFFKGIEIYNDVIKGILEDTKKGGAV